MKTRRPTSELVLEVTATVFDLTEQELLSWARPDRIARPRMAAMCVLYELGWSLLEVGRFFGNRDHGTVINARRRIPLICAQDEVFAERVQILRRAFALPPLSPAISAQTSVKSPVSN